jgi:hypothetical protein
MKRTLALCLLVACVGAEFVGCGNGPRTASVIGSITYQGKPVPNANVSFTPVDEKGRAATGLTDSGGRFTLGTFTASDGAIPGSYRVSVIARGPERAPKPGEVNSGMPGEMMPGDPIIPTKYFAPDTSGLTFDVKRGSNRAEFQLSE